MSTSRRSRPDRRPPSRPWARPPAPRRRRAPAARAPSSGRRPATSCGSRSSCSSSSRCASSGRSITATGSSGCAARWAPGSGAGPPTRSGRGRLMGLAFETPLALLLLIPALALTFGLYLSRPPAGGGGPAAHGAHRPDRPAQRARPGPGRVPARPAGRPAGDGLRRRPVRLGRQRGPRGRARLPARDAGRVIPEGDVAGIVAFGKDALVERLPSDLGEIDRIASTPVTLGQRRRAPRSGWPPPSSRTTPRSASSCMSDGNDTSGTGQAEAALAATRDIRIETRLIGLGDVRRGPRRAPDDAVHGQSRRVGRGRRRDPLVGRPAGDRPPVRQRRAGRRRPDPSTSTPA